MYWTQRGTLHGECLDKLGQGEALTGNSNSTKGVDQHGVRPGRDQQGRLTGKNTTRKLEMLGKKLVNRKIGAYFMASLEKSIKGDYVFSMYVFWMCFG